MDMAMKLSAIRLARENLSEQDFKRGARQRINRILVNGEHGIATK
jgi:hypothetical protein